MRSLLDIRRTVGRKLYGELSPSTIRVGPKAVIKGPCYQVELEAMNHVAKFTTIPLPRVIKTHESQGHVYIEMEYIHGHTLENAWHGLSATEKHRIMHELASYVSQLRALQTPSETFVGSANQNPLRDIRIGYDLFGPYQDHDHFHSLLRGHIPLADASRTFAPEVAECHAKKYNTLFAHGDLCMRNIIVQDGRIQAIIDWEFAGWYPEYWEYTKAHYAQRSVPDFYALLNETMQIYDAELRCERALWDVLREPGQYLHQQVRHTP